VPPKVDALQQQQIQQSPEIGKPRMPGASNSF
jgi:hypothetical protein